MDNIKPKRKYMPSENVLTLLQRREKYVTPIWIDGCIRRLNQMQGGSWFWSVKTEVEGHWCDDDTYTFKMRRSGNQHLPVEVVGELSRCVDNKTFVEFEAYLTRGAYRQLIIIMIVFMVVLRLPPFALFIGIVMACTLLETFLFRNALAHDVHKQLGNPSLIHRKPHDGTAKNTSHWF